MSESTNLEGSDPKSFAAGGLKLIPFKAMKEWQIQFSGKMVYVKDPPLGFCENICSHMSQSSG